MDSGNQQVQNLEPTWNAKESSDDHYWLDSVPEVFVPSAQWTGLYRPLMMRSNGRTLVVKKWNLVQLGLLQIIYGGFISLIALPDALAGACFNMLCIAVLHSLAYMLAGCVTLFAILTNFKSLVAAGIPLYMFAFVLCMNTCYKSLKSMLHFPALKECIFVNVTDSYDMTNSTLSTSFVCTVDQCGQMTSTVMFDTFQFITSMLEIPLVFWQATLILLISLSAYLANHDDTESQAPENSSIFNLSFSTHYCWWTNPFKSTVTTQKKILRPVVKRKYSPIVFCTSDYENGTMNISSPK